MTTYVSSFVRGSETSSPHLGVRALRNFHAVAIIVENMIGMRSAYVDEYHDL